MINGLQNYRNFQKQFNELIKEPCRNFAQFINMVYELPLCKSESLKEASDKYFDSRGYLLSQIAVRDKNKKNEFMPDDILWHRYNGQTVLEFCSEKGIIELYQHLSEKYFHSLVTPKETLKHLGIAIEYNQFQFVSDLLANKLVLLNTDSKLSLIDCIAKRYQISKNNQQESITKIMTNLLDKESFILRLSVPQIQQVLSIFPNGKELAVHVLRKNLNFLDALSYLLNQRKESNYDHEQFNGLLLNLSGVNNKPIDSPSYAKFAGDLRNELDTRSIRELAKIFADVKDPAVLEDQFDTIKNLCELTQEKTNKGQFLLSMIDSVPLHVASKNLRMVR